MSVGRNAAANRAAFPDVASFVDQLRDAFGGDQVKVEDVYRPGDKGHERILVCTGCKRLQTVSGIPQLLRGVYAVSCVCGRLVAVGRRRIVMLQPQQEKSRVLVTPGLCATGDSQGGGNAA